MLEAVLIKFITDVQIEYISVKQRTIIHIEDNQIDAFPNNIDDHTLLLLLFQKNLWLFFYVF